MAEDQNEQEEVDLFAEHKNKVITAARTAHQANKAYCESLCDFSQKNWEQAPDWQRTSAIKGVLYIYDRRVAREEIIPGSIHRSWMENKRADGWVYGKEKDAEAKTHPCLVPFEKLPEEQQKKDRLFLGNVFPLMF